MSGVLKAGSLKPALRPITSGLASSVGATAEDPTVILKERIGQLEGELAGLEASIPAKVAAARDEGRKAGLRERDESAARRLAALENGVAQAMAGWANQLEALDGLAIELARSILARMVGNPDWQVDFLSQAIAERLVELDRQSVVAVRVSASDFQDPETVPQFPDSKVRVEVVKELKSGECVIDLQMGHKDIGSSAQWGQVAVLLDELAERAPTC